MGKGVKAKTINRLSGWQLSFFYIWLVLFFSNTFSSNFDSYFNLVLMLLLIILWGTYFFNPMVVGDCPYCGNKIKTRKLSPGVTCIACEKRTVNKLV
jgi:hypothetical protein